jgi:hypothetical protein
MNAQELINEIEREEEEEYGLVKWRLESGWYQDKLGARKWLVSR